MQEYIILDITQDSQHDAVSYLEDEEMRIIERISDKQWWPASEFFQMLNIKKFTATEELG